MNLLFNMQAQSIKLNSVHSVAPILRFTLAAMLVFLLGSCGNSQIPQEALARFVSARIAYDSGNLAQADKEFEAIGAQFSGFQEARLMSGKTKFFLGDSANAQQVLRRLHDDFPTYYEATYWLGVSLTAEENLSEAEGVFLELLRQNSQDFRVYHQLGLIAMKESRIVQALDFLKRGMVFRDEHAQVALSLGQLYYSQGLMPEARQSLNTARALSEPGGPIEYATLEILRRISDDTTR